MLTLIALALVAWAGPVPDAVRRVAAIEAAATTGVVYDRVLPLARLERLDGGASAPATDRATWRQALDELSRAARRFGEGTAPDAPRAGVSPELAAVDASAREAERAGAIPLALIDRAAARLRPTRDDGARDDGGVERLRPLDDAAIDDGVAYPLVAWRVVAAAALVPRTYRGGDVAFRLDAERILTDGAPPRAIDIDFADGLGFRRVVSGEPVRVHYAATGTRVLDVRVTRADGSTARARASFEVAALAMPTPDDTLHLTASIAYQGQFGTGDAYVYRAPGHAGIENPAVVVEGFDLDNTMNWDELYALLNRENLLESLRADGFDLVVLNFTDATEAIQQNAFVVAEMVQQLEAVIPAQATLALAGASMGGLCSRYALAYLESHAIPHRVRTWISFDGPQSGANIPLGMQYWIRFFSGQSAAAAEFLATLDRPAARQMLLYHYTNPAGSTGQPDPMRAALAADLASVGGWPQLTRRVAIANGSGEQADQGFLPAAQVIRWEYSSALVAITGNVWAVPDAASAQIFKGSLRILFSTTTQNVSVNSTLPWDGAPGGWRASFTQLDTTAAPYGDIVALHPAHAFIPTISALALTNTTDPFYDVAGDASILAHTPFDAVYVPSANQEHVLVTPENAMWVRNEIERGVTGVGPGVEPRLALTAAPNPTRDETRFAITLPTAGRADLTVFDVGGRAVARVIAGSLSAGRHDIVWDGRDASRTAARPGVYFARLDVGGARVTRRVVRVE